MSDKDKVVMQWPTARIFKCGEEPNSSGELFEVWYERSPGDFEVISGGMTEEDAWAEAEGMAEAAAGR